MVRDAGWLLRPAGCPTTGWCRPAGQPRQLKAHRALSGPVSVSVQRKCPQRVLACVDQRNQPQLADHTLLLLLAGTCKLSRTQQGPSALTTLALQRPPWLVHPTALSHHRLLRLHKHAHEPWWAWLLGWHARSLSAICLCARLQAPQPAPLPRRGLQACASCLLGGPGCWALYPAQPRVCPCQDHDAPGLCHPLSVLGAAGSRER